MKYLRNAGIALGAILLAMGFAMLGRPARQRDKAEKREIDYLASQAKGSSDKARKQAALAETHKENAKKAADVGKQALKGIKDREIKELVSEWTR